MEALAKTLKQAREAKTLSQRELSKRTGVPQSHISKIEKSGVDLRVSSLNAIANALDLELALVPRKAVPAVKSISRSIETRPAVSPEVIRGMKEIAAFVNQIKTMKLDPEIVETLQHNFQAIRQIQNLIQDPKTIQKLQDLVTAIKGHEAASAAVEASDQMAEIRNILARAQSKMQQIENYRHKYQLDGDDDG